MIPGFLAGERLAWIFSGLFSAFAFVAVGAHIAPKATLYVKWLLLGLLAVLGFMAFAGGFVEGGRPVASLAGAMMVVVAVLFVRVPADELTSVSL